MVPTRGLRHLVHAPANRLAIAAAHDQQPASGADRPRGQSRPLSPSRPAEHPPPRQPPSGARPLTSVIDCKFRTEPLDCQGRTTTACVRAATASSRIRAHSTPQRERPRGSRLCSRSVVGAEGAALTCWFVLRDGRMGALAGVLSWAGGSAHPHREDVFGRPGGADRVLPSARCAADRAHRVGP